LSFARQEDHLTLDQICSTRSYQRKDLSGCQIVAGGKGQGAYSYERLAIRQSALDFRQFDLRGAVFLAGDFTRCDFQDAVLTGATFVRSTVTPAQIQSTRQSVIDPERDVTTGSMYFNPAHQLVTRTGYSDLGFSSVDLSGWDFTNADLRRSRFHAVRLDGVSFRGADIAGAEFWKSITPQQLVSTKSYRMGNLSGTAFVWLNLAKVDFSRQNVSGARLVHCDISGANFTDAIITDADLRYLDHPATVDQIKSTWNYKHGRMKGIRLPEELAKALEGEKPQKP